MSTPRSELTGVRKAVAEVLDEVNHRLHNLTSSHAGQDEFLEFLAERGYEVVPIDRPKVRVRELSRALDDLDEHPHGR